MIGPQRHGPVALFDNLQYTFSFCFHYFSQKSVEFFKNLICLKYKTFKKFLSYIYQNFFHQLTPVLVTWWGVSFSLGLVISALFWPSKRNFDHCWPGFKIFDQFWPVTKLTANYKDCKPNHLFLRTDCFMVNLHWNREKCFISFTGLSLFSNCHWTKKIFLKIWPDQWNYAKIVNGSVTRQDLTRPLR